MKDFTLEGLKELYRQEIKHLNELTEREMEKALCDMGLEVLKNIERPSDNPTFTQIIEEKKRQFYERGEKARWSGTERYALQEAFVGHIKNRLDELYGLLPECTLQGEIQFKKKDTAE